MSSPQKTLRLCQHCEKEGGVITNQKWGQVIEKLLLFQAHLIRPFADLVQVLGLDEPFPQFFKLLGAHSGKDGLNRIRADLNSHRPEWRSSPPCGKSGQ